MKETVNEDQGRPRFARLLELARLLRSEPFLTRAEAAQRLGITERQFYIDRQALAQSGFDFRWDRGQQRHVIERDELQPGISISYLESVALGCAVLALSKGGEPGLAAVARQALEKLLDAATTDSSQTQAVRELLGQVEEKTDSNWVSGAPPAYVESFAKSLAERRTVHMSYSNLDRELKDYKVQVYALFVGGLDGLSLYADVWDIEARQYKIFRLSRVSSCKLGDYFRPRTDYSFGKRHQYVWSVWQVGIEPTEVRCHVRPAVAEVVRERVRGRFKTIDRADGSCEVDCKVTSVKELVWWTMLWGGNVFVTSPPEAVEMAREVVRELSVVYHLLD